MSLAKAKCDEKKDGGQWFPRKKQQDINPVLLQWLASVADAGLPLKQHWFNVLCLLGLSAT